MTQDEEFSRMMFRSVVEEVEAIMGQIIFAEAESRHEVHVRRTERRRVFTACQRGEYEVGERTGIIGPGTGMGPHGPPGW